MLRPSPFVSDDNEWSPINVVLTLYFKGDDHNDDHSGKQDFYVLKVRAVFTNRS